MNFLNLPQQHIIDRIIPKEMLYENAELTENEKKYFVNSVDRVKLYYALRTDNSNIEADIIEDCTYDEIVFIELKLRNLDNFDKILKIIHSSIPKPLVIVSNYEEDIAISVATKTNSNNKIKVIEIFNTPRLVGAKHLIACFKQNGNDKIFDTIGFNMREYLDLLSDKKLKVDIVFTIDKTVRDGRTYPQLRLKDLRLNQKEIQEN